MLPQCGAESGHARGDTDAQSDGSGERVHDAMFIAAMPSCELPVVPRQSIDAAVRILAIMSFTMSSWDSLERVFEKMADDLMAFMVTSTYAQRGWCKWCKAHVNGH